MCHHYAQNAVDAHRPGRTRDGAFVPVPIHETPPRRSAPPTSSDTEDEHARAIIAEHDEQPSPPLIFA